MGVDPPLDLPELSEKEFHIAILGGRAATWSTQALRVGIYQYESQIAIFWWWVDLPLDLPELSE